MKVPLEDIQTALMEFYKEIEVYEHQLFKYLHLSPDLFAPIHNKRFTTEFSPKQIKRKDHIYFPPIGWYGYALKVAGKYDHGDDQWLDGPKFWHTAYHGVRARQDSAVESIA